MCGIFGIFSNNLKVNGKNLKKEINSLFVLSQSRGKEAAGIAISYQDRISVLKEAIPASKMIKTVKYNRIFDDNFKNSELISEKFRIIGHSRLVTDGSEDISTNNQPIIKNGFITIHNGIITNIKELFFLNNDIERMFEVDTEIIPSLLNKYLGEGINIVDSIKKIFNVIEGAATISILSSKYDFAVLATNNGSLYYTYTPDKNNLVFTSEKFILETYLKSSKLFRSSSIMHLSSWSGLLFNMGDNRNLLFNFDESFEVYPIISNKEKIILDNSSTEKINIPDSISKINITSEHILEDNSEEIKNLRRCSNCLLPETFPYINYDIVGVCNYCNNYKIKFVNNTEERQNNQDSLFKISEKYKSSEGYNVIVPFSGGRDSSYGLDYIKRKLGLNPVTFTYDWGMITDLARRNIARVCGKLGIENILVSADIRKKRTYIRKNVEAWLKRPELGIIPLFMAGDKQFFYFMNKLKRETGIRLNIWMTNPLENTDFKSGFAGIKPNFSKNKIDDLSIVNKLNMIYYYSKEFINNPSYINSSIFDTIWAFSSYYLSDRKDYILLFDYLNWDEKEIEDYLIKEYNWELSPDSKSSWRIGDGTAAFYNYIYYTVCGFTENDTFRSNQIREGMLSRDAAMIKIYEENKPREISLKWYCSTIGVDYENAIKTINKIPKLYRKG